MSGATGVAACSAMLLYHAVAIAADRPAKDVNTVLIAYGGTPRVTTSVAQRMGKFDIVITDRWRYFEGAPNSWAAIKNVNPFVTILTYQLGPESATSHENTSTYYLNNISRFRKSRGHSQGSIVSHPEWILLKRRGVQSGEPEFEHLDFGLEAVRSYWSEATIHDLVSQPWRADGVMIDNCLVDAGGIARALLGTTESKYANTGAWNAAMNGFVGAVTTSLRARGQKVMVNRGGSRLPAGRSAWEALDKLPNAPEFAMEEGAFAVSYGTGDVQFYPAGEWRNQVTLPSAVQNSSIVYVSHTDLSPGAVGFDSSGRHVSFGQIFVFAVGSYLLARSDVGPPTYFSFNAFRGKDGYSNLDYFSSLDLLDLGDSLTDIVERKTDGGTVFERRFARGVVFVNPSVESVEVGLDRNYRQFETHDGFRATFTRIDGRIRLEANSAAILLN